VVILLVGKSTDTWKELKDKLEAGCHGIIPAVSCIQGRKILEDKPEIDLVIVDAAAIEASGRDFLKAVRSHPRYGQIPVIVVGSNFKEESLANFISVGVTDIVLLPVSKSTLEAKLARAETMGKRTVLVIDDEPVIVEILQEFLQLERFKVLTAGTAEEGLEILSKQRVDVVVSDFMLPGKTGEDILNEVKSKYPGVPVILITGYSGKMNAKKAIDAGADGYFSKPFHNKDLAFTLRSVLASAARNRPKEKPVA